MTTQPEAMHTTMDHDILLETIVAITEQRDQHSLELSLLASLREMLDPTHAFFLEITGGGAARQVYPSRHEEVELDEAVLQLARDMSEHDFRSIRTATMAYILAITELGKDGGRRVLLVGLPAWTDDSERMLVGMVRVYQNFMKLMSDSEKDTLTGLQNRRKLESYLSTLLAARLNGHRQSDQHTQGRGEYLAVLDLDKFKRINDTYGHLIGDEVLLTFANILRSSLREADRAFRYGGEEFIVVVNDVNDEQAERVLERVRRNVEKHDFPQVGRVTVSIGYTLIDRQDLPPRIIEEADKALYYAKENGRNQVRDFRALLHLGAVEDSQHDGSIELF